MLLILFEQGVQHFYVELDPASNAAGSAPRSSLELSVSRESSGELMVAVTGRGAVEYRAEHSQYSACSGHLHQLH